MVGDGITADEVAGAKTRLQNEVFYANDSLSQPGNVIGQRALRELRGDDVVAVGLQALDDGGPAGPVGPRAVDQNDVRASGHYNFPQTLMKLSRSVLKVSL